MGEIFVDHNLIMGSYNMHKVLTQIPQDNVIKTWVKP
jgi:hypothetical protein